MRRAARALLTVAVLAALAPKVRADAVNATGPCGAVDFIAHGRANIQLVYRFLRAQQHRGDRAFPRRFVANGPTRLDVAIRI